MRAIAERESHAPRHEQGGPGKLERVNAPRGSTTAARGCSASKPVRATRSQAHSYAVCSEATRLWRVTSAIAAPGPSAQSAPRGELVDRLASREAAPPSYRASGQGPANASDLDSRSPRDQHESRTVCVNDDERRPVAERDRPRTVRSPVQRAGDRRGRPARS